MNWRVAAAIESALVVASIGLLGGYAGYGRWTASIAGVVLMGSLAVPALGLLMWARERPHAIFMSAVGAVMMGKFALVGGLFWLTWKFTAMPPLEFVLGLMVGWIASFVVQALVLRATIRPAGN